MDWEPNERDAWVEDAQRWICSIHGVLQAKIDLDESGEITGVHVVAGMDREPRHIVRDVESLLKARLDLEVYYKKIGVVQVLDNGSFTADPRTPEPATAPEPETAASPPPSVETIKEGAPADPAPAQAESRPTGQRPSEIEAQPAILLAEEIPPRLVCNGVGTMASNETVRAEVILQAGEVEARGACEGLNSHASDLTLVARAALEAISELLDEPVLLHLNEIRQESAGGRQILLVAVDLVEGRRTETLFGTCAAEHNRQQAVVYAVLDAMNRRLSLYALKSDRPARLEATG